MAAKGKVVVILGPTATGKSACGILLAEQIKGEIISGDSMLVYKGMNIATAKPTEEELARVPHHLVNILEPGANFNVVDFQAQAGKLITEINHRGKIPIIVGGTGLYIQALLENYTFAHTGESGELREYWEAFAQAQGNQALHDKLARVSPAEAARLEINDRRRIIRALEVAKEGERVSQEKAGEMPYDSVVFGLSMPREKLYARINKRVEDMVEAGIFSETRQLLEAGVPQDAQAMKSIGYHQILAYFQGKYDRETCIDKIKQATRNFAKRQETWYKRMPYIHWLEIEENISSEFYVKQMLETLHNTK